MTKTGQQLIRTITRVSADLNVIHDSDLLLERALSSSRSIIPSEAGSIYLLEDDALVFKFVQNDRFPPDAKDKRLLLYQNRRLPLTSRSISGFVALTGNTVCEQDVYRIDRNAPYTFDDTFDKQSGFHTVSVIAIPLKNSENEIFGVLQLLNRIGCSSEQVAFSVADTELLELFATFVASAYERAVVSREIIMRMVEMARLRDPLETGGHVNRVASYSVEIYRAWAAKRGESREHIDTFVDTLRIAAMLHDIGKVAISDTILKKPGKLTDEEFRIIKQHPIAGEQLFARKLSRLDRMSAVIARTHHERWDGKGYPDGLSGEQIPIEGRIVAVADVFDALSSRRVYKAEWGEQEVLDELKRVSGSQFDPEVIEAFFSVYDVITLIRERYSAD